MLIKAIYLLIFTFSLLGCSQQPLSAEYLWTNPQPTPDFIAGYSNIPISVSNQSTTQALICVKYNEAAIVKNGDTPSKIEQDLKATTKLEIDDKKIDGNDLSFYEEAGNLIGKYDDKDNYLGSYGTGFTACFSTDKLSKGFHLAKIQFARSSDETHLFSWAFRVD